MRDEVIRNDRIDDDQKIEKADPCRGNGRDGGDQCAERLEHCCSVFTDWFGEKYDLDVLKCELAVCAAEQLPGDPPWLMIISGSGNAKTETAQATTGLGARVISSISSIGALLSAAPRKAGATGGLLKEIGERGILVVKDFTSILSLDRTQRALILAALREIYDGYWVRDVGEGGGRKLIWRGRLIMIAACTTAWDQAHTVIAAMGDRFVYIRPDSNAGRIESGKCAIGNTGMETDMRAGLAEAVKAVIDGAELTRAGQIKETDKNTILQAANVVTLARTAVEMNYHGDVIDAHAPEMPTRLAKQLKQIMCGALVIGMERDEALKLVLRCARDSMPPLRLAVLLDVARNPDTPIMETRRRLQKPRATVDRTLQALHILGLFICRETPVERAGKEVQVRHYSLCKNVNLTALFPDGSLPPSMPKMLV